VAKMEISEVGACIAHEPSYGRRGIAGRHKCHATNVPLWNRDTTILVTLPLKILRCTLAFVGGRLNMRKRTRRGDIANFNFAREYLELKILREEVERIEVSSRTHPSKAAVAARDAQKANHCTRNRLQY
jgi:hypothetical protein